MVHGTPLNELDGRRHSIEESLDLSAESLARGNSYSIRSASINWQNHSSRLGCIAQWECMAGVSRQAIPRGKNIKTTNLILSSRRNYVTKIFNGRYTAKTDQPFVLFLIGMRINQWWRFDKWIPVASAMTPMLTTLFTHPEKGFLARRIFLELQMVAGKPLQVLEERQYLGSTLATEVSEKFAVQESFFGMRE